jgi:hypothetical protein
MVCLVKTQKSMIPCVRGVYGENAHEVQPKFSSNNNIIIPDECPSLARHTTFHVTSVSMLWRAGVLLFEGLVLITGAIRRAA